MARDFSGLPMQCRCIVPLVWVKHAHLDQHQHQYGIFEVKPPQALQIAQTCTSPASVAKTARLLISIALRAQYIA